MAFPAPGNAPSSGGMTAPTTMIRRRQLPSWLFRPLPPELGWPPYLWLLYVVPFVVWPLLAVASARQLIAAVPLFLLFLWSYFQAYSAAPRHRLLHVGLQATVGLVMLPWNEGSVVFFIFAAAVAGRLEEERVAWRVILLVGVVGTVWAWLMNANLFTVLPVAFMTPLIGAVTLHQERERRAVVALHQATARNRELAATAERERIARDLHDALGHTLSLVVLKAQVAKRLAHGLSAKEPQMPNPADSASSILLQELSELEAAARGALQDVRRAVRGYRATLDEAVRASRTLIEAAGVTCEVSIALTAPDHNRDAVLAAVLRELCTNVVRHAGARHCRISLHETATGTQLTVVDDGRGGVTHTGEGLRGVTERVHAVGGQVRVESRPSPGASSGTTVVVTLPPAFAMEATP